MEGIDPELEEQLNKFFLNTTIGDHSWAPSKRIEISTTNPIQVEESADNFNEFVLTEAIKEDKKRRKCGLRREESGRSYKAVMTN